MLHRSLQLVCWLLWKDELIRVDIDDEIRLRLREVKEKLVGRAGQDAIVLFENVQLAETKNWHEPTFLVEDLKRQPVLTVAEELSHDGLRLAEVESQQSREQTKQRVAILTELSGIL